MRTAIYLASAVLAVAAAGPASAEDLAATGVVTGATARTETFEWGSLVTYFDTDTYAATDSLVAVAVVDPGKQIHPPHVHSEEEYLVVIEGTGTWSVKGREFEATAGDTLYAAPWDEHGITNTGTVPLKFFVVKWNPKPVEPMPAPEEQEEP